MKLGRGLLENWYGMYKDTKQLIDFFDDDGMLGGMDAYREAGELAGNFLYKGLFSVTEEEEESP